MNAINHFLFALWLSLLFFQDFIGIKTILLMVLVFGIFIDGDQLIMYLKAKRKDNGELRTWLQEPLGFFFIFVPIAWILSFANPLYFPLVLLIVASHIFLDYITHHHVQPLAPVRKKKKMIGFVKAFPNKNWAKGKQGFSEAYFMGVNLLILLLVMK